MKKKIKKEIQYYKCPRCNKKKLTKQMTKQRVNLPFGKHSKSRVTPKEITFICHHKVFKKDTDPAEILYVCNFKKRRTNPPHNSEDINNIPI